jgi:hypothetical protein
MFSRYTAMKESKIKDTVDQELFPDPLSVNYNLTQMSQIPKLRNLSSVDLRRFWVFMVKQYGGIAEADDVLLTLNNIPYIGMLEPGADIYLVDISDLKSFASQQKK